MIHRKELELPPKYNYYAGDYLMREWFFETEKSYLKNHVRIRSWSMVKKSTLIKKIKILNYKWVYINKFY